MTTQNIFRNTHTTNFTVLGNDIINDDRLTGNASAAILYLLSKPPYWQFNPRDLKRKLQVGMNKVYKVMSELIKFGYAKMWRVQSGSVWNFFETPQIEIAESSTGQAESHCVNFERVENKCELERNELVVKNTTTHIDPTAPEKEQQEIVVVSLEIEEQELIFPPQIQDTKALKAVLKNKLDKKLIEKQPAIAQDVLFALAYSMTNSAVHNPCGLLTQLCKAANNGTFTNPTSKSAAGGSNRSQASIDKTQQTLEAYRSMKASKPTGVIDSLRVALRVRATT